MDYDSSKTHQTALNTDDKIMAYTEKIYQDILRRKKAEQSVAEINNNTTTELVPRIDYNHDANLTKSTQDHPPSFRDNTISPYVLLLYVQYFIILCIKGLQPIHRKAIFCQT